MTAAGILSMQRKVDALREETKKAKALAEEAKKIQPAVAKIAPIVRKIAPLLAEASRRERLKRQALEYRTRVVAPQGRRLDRRLACPRPRTRAVVRASSKGGDSGDPDLGDEAEPPARRPLLLLVHEQHGRVDLAMLRTLRVAA
jgi:hypothetical protein